MTKNLFRYFFMVLALGCTFTSCSDDDEQTGGGNGLNFLETTTTFTEANGLAITYSGDTLSGKQVVFTPNGKEATLVVSGLTFSQFIGIDTLNLPTVGLIPGETTTTLKANMEVVNDNEVTFSGEETRSNCTIKYNGTAKASALTLNVNVKMAENALTNKTFKANSLAFGEKPFHINWTANKFAFDTGTWDINSALKMVLMMTQIDNMTIPQMLCGVLNEVTFLEDGNIQALYHDSIADTIWHTSPLNLATYNVESDSTLRLFIHPNQILAITKAAKMGRAVDLDKMLESLIGVVSKLCVEGVVLEYKINKQGALSVYLTKDTLLPILQIVKPIFEDESMVQMILALLKGAAGENAGMVALLEPILVAFPDIIDSTSHIDLGLDLDPVVVEK